MLVVEGTNELGDYGTYVPISREIVKDMPAAIKHLEAVAKIPLNTGRWEISIEPYVEKKKEEPKPVTENNVNEKDAIKIVNENMIKQLEEKLLARLNQNKVVELSTDAIKVGKKDEGPVPPPPGTKPIKDDKIK